MNPEEIRKARELAQAMLAVLPNETSGRVALASCAFVTNFVCKQIDCPTEEYVELYLNTVIDEKAN